jgi:precorrin-2/cobalt-factor-2 C20-methyltransferase
MATFYGLGVGPGDKELVTLKAINILKKTDVLIVPVSTGGKSTAFDIVREYVGDNVELIYCDMPMIRDHMDYEKNGAKVAKIVEDNIRWGNDVAFITLGDPMIYSTYGYILKALDKSVEVVTIPGVPSFCACAAATNTMLCEKSESLTIIPSVTDEAKIEKAAEISDNIIFMKVNKNGYKLENLLSDMEYIFVSNCGMADEKISRNDIEAVKSNKKYFSTIIAKRGGKDEN